MKKILTIILAFLCLKGTAQSIQEGVKEIGDKYKAVGIAYVVVKNGKIVEKGAVGYHNLEEKTPLDVDNSVFRIASISKSFTATALMQLVEKKKISLDDDFGKLLGFPIRNPNFPEKVITLRMVLSHTSSINDVNGYFDLEVINPEKNKDWAKSYNNNEPGSTYQYCNLNFNMAGAVLEKISGIRFDNYIKQQILDPLKLYGGYNVGMLDHKRLTPLYTYSDNKNAYEVQPAAYSPRNEEINNYIIGHSTPIFSPTGGMKISATDLAKYMLMHMNYGKSGKTRIISEKSAKEMQSKLSEQQGYGLALRETQSFIPQKKMVGHTGSAYGLYSSMFFDPKEKFGIVVITNGCIPESKNGFIALSQEICNYLYKNVVE